MVLLLSKSCEARSNTLLHIELHQNNRRVSLVPLFYAERFRHTFLTDDLPARQDGEIAQQLFATIAKTGSFHRQHIEDAAQFVHDECCQVLAIDMEVPV